MKLFLYISSLQQASSISCLDESGKPVDSWTAIKGSNDFNYYVYNPEVASWVLSPYYLNQTEGTDGCIMGTVGALYGAGSDGATYDMLGLYNDEQVSILYLRFKLYHGLILSPYLCPTKLLLAKWQ